MNDSSFIISGSGSKIAYRASCRRASCLYSQAETGFAVHLMSKKELHHAIVSADGVVRFTKTQHAQDRAGILSGASTAFVFSSWKPRVYLDRRTALPVWRES